MRGIESTSQGEGKNVNIHIFLAVSTVINFIALIVSCAVWYEKQIASAIVIGLVFMALGCMVFGIGLADASEKDKVKGRRIFWSFNIWLLSFLPLSFVYNLFMIGLPAPYPLPVNPLITFPLFWFIYFAVCLGVILLQRKNNIE